ncbi:MAG: amidohydrolase, partial [Pirellulaceae bacterium]
MHHVPATRHLSLATLFALALLLPVTLEAQKADLVFINANILTVDQKFSHATALAIKDGTILAVGSNNDILKLAGPKTRQIQLNGATVLPGLIETHVHALGVGLSARQRTYVELNSIAELQNWLRREAKLHPVGTWIRIPRADITRLKERRHPTPAELDAACTTHPVLFNAARKNVLNTLGFRLLGITDQTQVLDGGKVIRDARGKARMIAGGDTTIRKFFPPADVTEQQRQESLISVHRRYNQVGITSVFERANNKAGYQLYQQLQRSGKLTVRSTHTIRQQFRSADQVASFTKSSGLLTGQGDDWVRVGPLKITVDGGIHWGTTHLREPYGPRRIRFYALEGIQDPSWQGSSRYTVNLMRDIFREGHKLGWQMCCHVTGDAGVDSVLQALSLADADFPLADRRFTLTHAYFPALDSIALARRLGVCVDTQSYLYYRDSEAIASVYGPRWADRFIGLGDWIRGSIPTAINSDHMIGMDPDHAMNSYNPFLLMQIAVSRLNDAGNIHGRHQRISRQQALRCYTSSAAYLGFEEDRKGSLEAGKLADLIVIDRDYQSCPVDQIKDIRVLQTMVNGKFVYER